MFCCQLSTVRCACMYILIEYDVNRRFFHYPSITATLLCIKFRKKELSSFINLTASAVDNFGCGRFRIDNFPYFCVQRCINEKFRIQFCFFFFISLLLQVFSFIFRSVEMIVQWEAGSGGGGKGGFLATVRISLR